MKRVVVTGASSPLGRALIDYLIEKDLEVLAICRKNSKKIELIPKSEKIAIVECELSQLSDLVIKEENWDTFYHFAWAATDGIEGRENAEVHVDNIKYTIDAVKLAKSLGCVRFIGSGSQAEYGRVNRQLDESMPTFPESAYGIAKLCAGQMSRLICKQLNIEHVWARIFCIYGPYDNENKITQSIINSLINNISPLCTKGEQIWDFLYAKDAARALYLLGKYGKNEKVYCLGSGEAKPLREYIEEIRDMINPSIAIKWGEIPYHEKQEMYLWADISNIMKDTNFRPRYSFSDGIKEMIDNINHKDADL